MTIPAIGSEPTTMTDRHSGPVLPIKKLARPIFLVGAERSGTTLLRLMLDHHPSVAFHFEFEFAVDRIAPDGGFPDLGEYHRWLRANRIFRHAGWAIDESLDYPALVNSFLLQQQAAAGNKPVIGATVHRSFDKLRLIWPDARYIHIVRDGRDVCRSVMQMGWAGNPWTAATWWLDAEETWQCMEQLIPENDRCEVRYEELISKPQPTLERLCQFIGVAYSPVMMEYVQNSTYERPDPKFAAQWKSKMTRSEVQLCETRLNHVLTDRGYQPSGFPPKRVGALHAGALRLHDRYWRMRFRQKRYRLPLWLADVFSRRVGNEALRSRVRDALNAVDTALLR